MKTLRPLLVTSMHICALIVATTSIQAQRVQTTGTLGSPGATTTISGKQHPAPDPKFGGMIKDNALQLLRARRHARTRWCTTSNMKAWDLAPWRLIK